MAFIVALLGLTIVFLQNGNTHVITCPSLSSVLFCFTYQPAGKTRRLRRVLVASNESLEVLVSADKADGARGWELHARLAKRISSGEVVLRMDLD